MQKMGTAPGKMSSVTHGDSQEKQMFSLTGDQEKVQEHGAAGCCRMANADAVLGWVGLSRLLAGGYVFVQRFRALQQHGLPETCFYPWTCQLLF